MDEQQTPGDFLIQAGEAIQNICDEQLNRRDLGSAYFVLNLTGQAIAKLGWEMEKEVWTRAESLSGEQGT